MAEPPVSRDAHPPLVCVQFSTGEPQQPMDVRVDTTTGNITSRTPTLRLLTIRMGVRSLSICLLFFVLVEFAIASRVSPFLAFLLLIALIALVAYQMVTYGPIVEENCNRLREIFAQCSHITDFYLHNINRDTLKVVRKTLGDVPIKFLIVYEDKCDADLRKTMVEMAQTHKIEKIVVCVRKCNANRLRQFFLDVTQTVQLLKIYETIDSSELIFGKPREFWEKEAREMSDGSFSVQVMNGERFLLGEGTHLSRFKIGA